VDESSDRNPHDEVEEIILNMREQVMDISCNMAFHMVALEKTLEPFGDVGGSN